MYLPKKGDHVGFFFINITDLHIQVNENEFKLRIDSGDLEFPFKEKRWGRETIIFSIRYYLVSHSRYSQMYIKFMRYIKEF